MKAINVNLRGKSGIYCIINIANQKRYVGSTKNLQQRLLKHRALLRHNKHENILLQNSWNKYKEQSFDYYILEFCSEDSLTQREQYYIDTLKPELNITTLVERNILSKESREKQSNTRKKLFREGLLKTSWCKPIHKYSLEGVYLDSYSNCKEACIKNNLHQSTLCRYLNGTNRKAGGFLWCLEKVDSLAPYRKFRTDNGKMNKKVQVIYDDKVVIYDSLKSCAISLGIHKVHVSYLLKHGSRSRKGYMIKYYTAV